MFNNLLERQFSVDEMGRRCDDAVGKAFRILDEVAMTPTGRTPSGAILVDFPRVKSKAPSGTPNARRETIPKPRPAFGEDGQPTARTQLRPLNYGADVVPMRIPIDYNYAEPFGMAEVSYVFEMGKTVILAAGGACRIERLKAGMQFQLKGGGFATVTKVEDPIPWPERHPKPDENGNVLRRILGKVKHIGYVVLDVFFAGQKVTTTPGHKFKTLNREWVSAIDLRRGDTLQGVNGSAVRVESVSSPRHGFIELHNLEVEISHTYYVSGQSPNGNPVSSILVHNGLDCIKLPAYEQEMMEADGLTIRGANQVGVADAEMHHIATIYEGDNQWASQFNTIFNKAGFSLEDDINKIMVEGHFGEHPELYHQMVFNELDAATVGREGDAYRNAFMNTMQNLRGRVTNPYDILNALITH